MDRTGWTPLQIAWADHAAAEAALHDLRNDLWQADTDLRDEESELDASRDVLNRLRERRDQLAAQIGPAEQRVADTETAYLAAKQYSRKMFADELGIAPNTLSGYVSRGQAPRPDSKPGDIGHPWWYGTTVRAYATRERRPGTRTDIKEQGMTTTTLATFSDLDASAQADGWYAYIGNGEYSQEQQDALVGALLDAQRAAVDDALPDGCRWQPATAEIVGPVGAEIGDHDEIREILRAASESVVDRFAEIEAEVLGA